MCYELEVVDLQNLPPATAVLSAAELAFYQTLKVPKRRTEWLGGRLALKKLLCAQLGGAWTDVTVLVPGGVGKPSVTAGGKIITIPFSLTHSNGFAVAALAPHARYIGIDLEQITPRIASWKDQFFHPSELAACPADVSSDEFLTLLWTQKEALVKLLGSGLTVNTLDVRVVGGNPVLYGRALEIYTALGTPHLTLETLSLLPGFCCSVAVGKTKACTG